MKTYRLILFITAALLVLTTVNALTLPNGYVLLTKSVAMGLALYSAYYHRGKSWITAVGMLSLALFIAPWDPFSFDTVAARYMSSMVAGAFIRLALNLHPIAGEAE